MKKFLLCLFCMSHCFAADLSDEALHSIGMRIWQNECRGTLDGLVSWNEGEEFPSLGIGHFIWYPKDTKKNFEETFPALLALLKEKEVKLPFWLSRAKHFPWKTRAEFLKAKRTSKINALRDILSETINLQMQFIVSRFEASEQQLLANASEDKKPRVAKHLEMLKQTPEGLFALIDYVNFKGSGLSETERYRGQGWGLLQVLETLPGDLTPEKALEAFSLGAIKVLKQRVRNAPKSRNEERWLKGWQARIETYKKREI